METVSESSLRFNMQQITYCRTTTAVLTGSTAGILGLTGLLGFVLYFFTAVLVSVGLVVKAGSKSSSYFPSNYRFVISIHNALVINTAVFHLATPSGGLSPPEKLY